MSTATIAPGIAPPRIPKDSPVSATIIRTDNTPSGNGRALALVEDRRGRLVEVIDPGGGEDVEALLFARWPYFSSYGMRRFGDCHSAQAWPTLIRVAPSEYRRLRGLEPSPDTARLRALGDRCERFSRIREAVNRVSIDGRGEMPAVIYMRTADRGGDHADAAVRRAFARLERLGMVWRCDTTDGRTFRQYRPTSSTPAYR
jgi:hypothetical protein